MTFFSLQRQARKYWTVFFLEEFLPRRSRMMLEIFCMAGVFLLGILFLTDVALEYQGYFGAVFFLWLLGFIKLRIIDAYCNSREHSIARSGADFEAQSIIYLTDQNDIVRSFILADIGELCLRRAGANHDLLDSYLRSPSRREVSSREFDSHAGQLAEPTTLSDYAKAIVSLDPALLALLEKENVSPADVAAAAKWVSEMIAREREKIRWWSYQHFLRCFSHHSSTEHSHIQAKDCSMLPQLLLRASAYEAHYGVFFTYPALRTLAGRTVCRVVGTIVPEKACEMLDAISLWGKFSGSEVIGEKEARAYLAKR